MISHTIWTTKPPALSYTPGKRRPDFKPLTQEEFNKHLEDFKATIGDFVTLTPPLVHAAATISCVMHIETDVNKITYLFDDRDKPQFVRLCAISHWPGSHNGPWNRVCNPEGYRKLLDQEYDKYIKDEYDIIQNYLKLWCPDSETAHTAD